jgi:hypothetical protein
LPRINYSARRRRSTVQEEEAERDPTVQDCFSIVTLRAARARAEDDLDAR